MLLKRANEDLDRKIRSKENRDKVRQEKVVSSMPYTVDFYTTDEQMTEVGSRRAFLRSSSPHSIQNLCCSNSTMNWRRC